MTPHQLRDCFPYLKTGLVYLNHAATSPWSTSVEKGILDFQREWTHGEIEVFERAMGTIQETRDMAAEMIGCHASRLAFVQNTSDGLNVLASGLDWKSGDRIILAEMEFPSNVYPFLNLARLGVEIDFAPQRNGVILLDDIERLITPRTRLVAVSWVQFLSGFTIDLAALGALCRSKGVLLSVDAIQGIGARRLNLAETPVDFLSAGAQKWQMAPQGTGIIYVSEDMQERIAQASLGWLSVRNAWDFFTYELDLRDDARRYENGTWNTLGLHGYHGALSLFKEVGFDDVARMVRANAEYAYERVAEGGFDLLTPRDAAQRAGIVTFRHERSEDIVRALQKRRITVSARSGCIRLSPHFYNVREEIDAALAAIVELDRGA
ncbi:MAG: aminotransferase class V-fold PLP-dependent enzyme [Ignavibacteria bacterium]|nr:aminotransferase class V-fold PLP-dependent enzyme [Ignavibacteria bacterium]